MPTLVLSDGLSLGPAHCKVIVNAVPDNSSEEGVSNSVILDWSDKQELTALELDYPAIRLTYSPESASQFVASGRLGRISFIRDAELIQELIQGPQEEGFIRDLRLIGRHLYASGMGRQVYRRAKPGEWVRFEDGINRSENDYLDISGFNAIDGLSEEDIYAVGFDGEIWHCDRGKWTQVDSPTNLIIERVRAVKKDLVFAVGQAGLVLRGHKDTWVPITHSETTDDFWGLEWFQNELYLSTEHAVFRLDRQDRLERVGLNLAGERTYSHLHAGRGALWSFGKHHVSWTSDGNTWNDVVLG